MVGIVRDDKWCNVAFDSELFELALKNWIITGRVVYFNTISVIECYCARNFINGNEKKKSVFVWHECIFFTNQLWSDWFHSRNIFNNSTVDVDGSFFCVRYSNCNASKKIT